MAVAYLTEAGSVEPFRANPGGGSKPRVSAVADECTSNGSLRWAWREGAKDVWTENNWKDVASEKAS